MKKQKGFVVKITLIAYPKTVYYLKASTNGDDPGSGVCDTLDNAQFWEDRTNAEKGAVKARQNKVNAEVVSV